MTSVRNLSGRDAQGWLDCFDQGAYGSIEFGYLEETVPAPVR